MSRTGGENKQKKQVSHRGRQTDVASKQKDLRLRFSKVDLQEDQALLNIFLSFATEIQI